MVVECPIQASTLSYVHSVIWLIMLYVLFSSYFPLIHLSPRAQEYVYVISRCALCSLCYVDCQIETAVQVMLTVNDMFYTFFMWNHLQFPSLNCQHK